MTHDGTLKAFKLINRAVVQDSPHVTMGWGLQLGIEELVPTSRDEQNDGTICPCRMIRTSTTALI